MEYILTTENLTKAYGKHKAADQINIHIKKGEVYGKDYSYHIRQRRSG
jgi:ABC-2 type transport system ATP-binding protein